MEQCLLCCLEGVWGLICEVPRQTHQQVWLQAAASSRESSAAVLPATAAVCDKRRRGVSFACLMFLNILFASRAWARRRGGLPAQKRARARWFAGRCARGGGGALRRSCSVKAGSTRARRQRQD